MSQDQLFRGLDYALSYFNSIPGHWLYTIGIVIASIPLTAMLVQGIKHLHFKYTAKEMTDHFIDFVLLVTGFLMAAADFVITNGNNTKYLPQFLLVVVPTIKALAPSVYTYSKAIHSFFVNRSTETQKQRLSALGSTLDKALGEQTPVVVPVPDATQNPPTLLQL